MVIQMNGNEHQSHSIHVFRVGKMRIKLSKGKITKAKESYATTMQAGSSGLVVDMLLLFFLTSLMLRDSVMSCYAKLRHRMGLLGGMLAGASGRSSLNLERSLAHDGHPLAITAAEAVTANGVPPWNWRETPGNGGDSQSSYGGRVILVKWGEYTRRIGIDDTAEAIKEAIKSAFGLRTRQAFWLEDEDEVVRNLDRDMPLGTYSLHLDEGLTIKVCLYDETDRISVRTEEKILYSEEDFRDFLARRGWTCLRELSGFRCVDTLDAVHQG